MDQGLLTTSGATFRQGYGCSSIKNLKLHLSGCLKQFKDIYKGHAGLLRQVLVVYHFLQKRLLQWLSGAAP